MNGRRHNHSHTAGAWSPTVDRSRSSVVSHAFAQVASPVAYASAGGSRTSRSSSSVIRSGASASDRGAFPAIAASASSARASG
jgi:hypothetical protein